jgi:hypothetical protein
MPKQCVHCGETKSSKEFYGRETGCKECKKEKANEWKMQMEEDLAELDERVDQMKVDHKQLRRMSSDIITVQSQVALMSEMGAQQKETIDDVVERLENLCIMVTRLTKSVMKMTDKTQEGSS